MQVDFYMFLDANAEFRIPDGESIHYDDANDKYNPFSVYNFKKRFEIETDDVIQYEMKQMILKNTIMFGNTPLVYNSLDKHNTLQNTAFIKDSMKNIERHIARNCLSNDVIEKYMIEDVIATTERNKHMDDENFAGALGGIYRYENAFLEFSEQCDNYTFASRFQCYFMNARYIQDALNNNMKVEYARSNPLVPMSSKIILTQA